MRTTKKKPARQSPAKTTEELVAALGEPLPKEVLKMMGNGLSSYAVTHVYDRLNKVLGVEGWSRKPKVTFIERNGEFDDQQRPYWEATAEIRIDLPALGKGVFRIGHGGHKATDRADAGKGAVSDAAKNALKDLIGKEIHMGLNDAPPDESQGKVFRLDKDGPPPKPTDKDVFIPFNGVVTEIVDGLQGSWIQINGETCYAEKRLAGNFDGSLNFYAEGNAKWWWPDGVTAVKKITGVIGVNAFAPMKIPTINDRES